MTDPIKIPIAEYLGIVGNPELDLEADTDVRGLESSFLEPSGSEGVSHVVDTTSYIMDGKLYDYNPSEQGE